VPSHTQTSLGLVSSHTNASRIGRWCRSSPGRRWAPSSCSRQLKKYRQFKDWPTYCLVVVRWCPSSLGRRWAPSSFSSSILLSSLKLSDTTIYEPSIRALLGTAAKKLFLNGSADGVRAPWEDGGHRLHAPDVRVAPHDARIPLLPRQLLRHAPSRTV